MFHAFLSLFLESYLTIASVIFDSMKYKQGPLNLITLEFSNTRLARCVESPSLVREIDWIDHLWPSTEAHDGDIEPAVLKGKASNSKTWPRVQKYCLMSVAGSYTGRYRKCTYFLDGCLPIATSSTTEVSKL